VGSRCSFCGTTDGPFLQVRGLFALLMCPACQAARSGSNRGLPPAQVDRPRRDPDPPAELLAHHDPGQPWYQWGCALCEAWVIWPGDLEGHTAKAHPGWTATFEIVRPYPQQLLRVVYRRVDP
jgi:hypothetical protein